MESTEVANCLKCGATTFQPSGRCMQGCDGFVKQSPRTIKSNTEDEDLAHFHDMLDAKH
jgi:hypothetical protein